MPRGQNRGIPNQAVPVSETDSPIRIAVTPATSDGAQIAFLERLPKWLICVPLLFQWIVLGLRYRGFMLPAVANPRITSGGLLGEGKSEYFKTMGPLGRAA
ncbi:MAG: hypothetical protein JWR16_2600, partial [Nevskia sp.]|nr:hypothetical protein [Nevskia sp.]